MQLDKIKAKLEALKSAQENKPSGNREFDDVLWSPKETGKYQIRIVPNKYQEDIPFVELNLYWGIFGRTLCSPSSFDRPDPVIEYCNSLLDSSKKLPKDEWMVINNIKRKLLPSKRIFIPILVRGKESEGVKSWGVSEKIYLQLLEIAGDADYGDIEDLQNGTDLTVDFVKDANDSRQNKYSILPKRNTSPVSDDPNVLAKIENMPDISKIFKEPTYDELKEMLKKYLMDGQSQSAEEKPKPDVKNVTNQTATEKFDTSNFTPPKGPAEEVGSVNISDIEKQFEDMLAGK